MLRPRITPCLLVHQGGLVKTQAFKDAKYVGDPINAVKIFNEKEADELIVLDIDATVQGREPDFGLIAKLAAETLQDKQASQIARSLAASALSQVSGGKQTGGQMEDKAAKVLASDHYSAETKQLAASVLAQANKER